MVCLLLLSRRLSSDPSIIRTLLISLSLSSEELSHQINSSAETLSNAFMMSPAERVTKLMITHVQITCN